MKLYGVSLLPLATDPLLSPPLPSGDVLRIHASSGADTERIRYRSSILDSDLLNTFTHLETGALEEESQ